MKINGMHRIGGSSPYSRQDTKPAELKGKREKMKDEVQISPQAQELLGAQGTGNLELRAQKLEELKQSIATGTYHVEARQLAEKLFPFVK